jgi:hypothetical protein
VRTEVAGLYLTGSNSGGHGISGVIKGGIGTVSAITGRNLFAEVQAGDVFGDPSPLSAHGPGWDAWESSRISD